jgi:hypothetical protein
LSGLSQQTDILCSIEGAARPEILQRVYVGIDDGTLRVKQIVQTFERQMCQRIA